MVCVCAKMDEGKCKIQTYPEVRQVQRGEPVHDAEAQALGQGEERVGVGHLLSCMGK